MSRAFRGSCAWQGGAPGESRLRTPVSETGRRISAPFVLPGVAAAGVEDTHAVTAKGAERLFGTVRKLFGF